MSTLLLGVVSSSPSLADNPHKIYAPGNVFIGKILAAPNKPTAAQKPVLLLDTLDLELELAKYEGKLELADLSAQRLADEYVTQFVTGPMNQVIGFRGQSEAFAQEVAQIATNKFGAGFPTGAPDQQQSLSHLNKTSAQKSLAIDALAKKQEQITVERAKNDAEKTELQKKIAAVNNQIQFCSILSPISGVLRLHVAEGIFVEKGDILFEVQAA